MTPEPHWNCHNGAPLRASTALHQPSIVQEKAIWPAGTSSPLHTGKRSWIDHALRRAIGSHAENSPRKPPGPALIVRSAPTNGVPAMWLTVEVIASWHRLCCG